jgi:hypothetical protein
LFEVQAEIQHGFDFLVELLLDVPGTLDYALQVFLVQAELQHDFDFIVELLLDVPGIHDYVLQLF